MDFADALRAMVKDKKHVRRSVWPDKSKCIYFDEKASNFYYQKEGRSYSPGRESILAEDWELAKTKEEIELEAHHNWLRERLANVFLSQSERDQIYGIVLGNGQWGPAQLPIPSKIDGLCMRRILASVRICQNIPIEELEKAEALTVKK